MPPDWPSAAVVPIPGDALRGSLRAGQRFVLRIPDAWNGRLVVAGTPSTRSEYANDLLWCDYLLASGYAFACSNKGVPYNAIVEPASEASSGLEYPVPFAVPGLPAGSAVVRLGVLEPRRVAPAEWNDDLAGLVRAARAILAERRRPPERVYAVGLSVGGAQVRTLLERQPDLVDGGVEWSSIYWSPGNHLLANLPRFLQNIPVYARTGCADPTAHDAIVAAGFPADRRQDDHAHRSLWLEFYDNTPPFYNDVTTFMFAALLDPEHAPPQTVEARAAYRPTPNVAAAVAAIAHTGAIGKPLIGIVAGADILIAPAHNAAPYLEAVVRAGSGALYRQYVVADATHVDAFTAFGYGLRPALPFARAAFEQLVAVVERGFDPGGAGTSRLVSDAAEIAAR
jgi:alpha-beta hydrolase superfamily lysophospholipase